MAHFDTKSLGIIGHGFVGKILKRHYKYAKVFDIAQKLDSLSDVLNQQVIFVALNFQDNCISDESKKALDDYFEAIENAVIIIKSTFVPGTTDYFQQKYPNLHFVYNPEFLTEATAWEDFVRPQMQVLGLTYKSLELANGLFSFLPDASLKRIISPLDAEVLKHAFNSYYALKVTWFNQLYDACKKVNADYETVREIMVKNPWVGDSHSIIFHKGYRGFGGKCLSKDPRAFAFVGDIPLLKSAIEYNEELLKKHV